MDFFCHQVEASVEFRQRFGQLQEVFDCVFLAVSNWTFFQVGYLVDTPTKRPVLPPCAVHGRSRNPLYYYCYCYFYKTIYFQYLYLYCVVLINADTPF